MPFVKVAVPSAPASFPAFRNKQAFSAQESFEKIMRTAVLRPIHKCLRKAAGETGDKRERFAKPKPLTAYVFAMCRVSGDFVFCGSEVLSDPSAYGHCGLSGRKLFNDDLCAILQDCMAVYIFEGGPLFSLTGTALYDNLL